MGTMFILIAIFAWALSCRPYVVTATKRIEFPPGQVGIYRDFGPGKPRGVVRRDATDGGFAESFARVLNPSLKWPGLALGVFLVLKIFQGVRRRRIERQSLGAS